MDDRPHVIPEDIEDESFESATASSSSSNRRRPFSPSLAFCLTELARHTQGRCGGCGIQTHIFGRNDNAVPLTITDEVLNGRCLLCQPLPGGRGCSPPGTSMSSLREGISEHNSNNHQSAETIQNSSSNNNNYEYTFSGKYPDLIDMLHAMKGFPDELSIQELGCETLWVHSWEDDMSRTIGSVGGIDRVLEALARFPNHYSLTVCACGTLQNLASTPSNNNRKEIIEKGGASLIVQAMMTHPSSISIQRSCCCALVSLLSIESRHYRTQILDVRGHFALAASLDLHPADPFIRYCASQAFHVLLVSQERTGMQEIAAR